jgi:RNA polymerase sigma-70 factor (ECF subfamily)
VWLRISGRDADGLENLGGWLTTVAGRICLDHLRRRRLRPEVPLDDDAELTAGEETDPEQAAVLADTVGVALLVVLDALAPAERIAFVLHDLFDVPFQEIARVVNRSPDAAKMLASRARRRVRTARTVPDAGLGRKRAVVDAFLAASRDGRLDALVAILDTDVVVHADGAAAPPGTPTVLHGAAAVAEQALAFSARAGHATPMLVNGAPGIVVAPHGRPLIVLILTIVDDRITELEIVAEPGRLQRLELTAFRWGTP